MLERTPPRNSQPQTHQVDESRRVGRSSGDLLLYYTLGSDPALWPAGGRREGELITYDKDIIIHVLRGLMPNYPTLIPKTTTPTPETLPPEGFVQALSGFDQLLKAVLEAS